MFMFVHLTKRTKFLVRVRLFNKRTYRRTFGSFTALPTFINPTQMLIIMHNHKVFHQTITITEIKLEV
ncbi:hypothetical protein Hanom_Chr02g00097301 [Helianthus anomalus]